VAAICHYHLRRLRQIRRRVGQEVTTRLVLATVISRLDYCNAALVGLPQATVAPLQRVQNSAARLIFKLSSREHVTPCLLQLHWLPVRWRVQFKLCYIMHCVSYGTCPAYLTNIVERAGAGRVHVLVYVQHRRPTTRCRGCAQSSRNVRFYRAAQLCYRGLGSRNCVRPSVRLSVRLSHACFVTNPITYWRYFYTT